MIFTVFLNVSPLYMSQSSEKSFFMTDISFYATNLCEPFLKSVFLPPIIILSRIGYYMSYSNI